MENGKKPLIEAVRKKAVGYVTVQTVTEYAVVDGKFEPVRKKVSEKEVPPDLAALKILMTEPEEELTPEQLRTEKLRLLGLLKEYENET